MRTLLFLNGPNGWQTGIEDGFSSLKAQNKISELKWFYFDDYAKKHSSTESLNMMLKLAYDYAPELIVFFHISKFPVTEEFIRKMRNLSSKPYLIYDEGDMYGGWAKPITNSMKILFRSVDFVSIRGLGQWYNIVKRYNKNVIYTPHSDSLHRISQNISLRKNRNNKIVFIGNKVKSRIQISRLNGARKRERFVEYISKNLPNEIKIFGNGWDKLTGNMGPLEFKKQTEVCSDSWIHISYEHYPKIPYYFSDRLPIALASGQIYICHYHKGYEDIFKNTDFVYFFKTRQEAIDIVNYLLSLSKEQLYEKSMHAKEWADKNLSPTIIWNNFFDLVTSK